MKVMKNEKGRRLSMSVVRRPACATMRWPVTRRINFPTNLSWFACCLPIFDWSISRLGRSQLEAIGQSWRCWTASTWCGALDGHAAAISHA
ncbi:hypothetical protein D917_10116 [Trichinella nativa]|uniref:Uncharacterized protein n=1 Tax=Trichinella nativa TaxID=6335 RepID=A0A1Y3ECW9_9BILA|nr:hypothetical protein D917_10116 [Trichinella nativa]